jgi:hypothetical protein
MSVNKKHETKHCPRCEAEFECKSGSILLCQCQTIYLTPEQMDYINAQFDDCLCVSCLAALRREYNCRQHQLKIEKISRE